MDVNKKIKDVFSNILGTEVNVESFGEETVPLSDKDLFIKIINDWSNAWKKQNELFDKFGIDFSGYDTILYNTIENLIVLKYGEIKYSVIVSFVCSEFNDGDNALMIVDKNKQQYFLKTTLDLYEFIQNMNDEDFIIKDNE